MPLLAIPFAAALSFVTLPYDIPADWGASPPGVFSQEQLADVELASVSGSGIPFVGVDQKDAAAAARSITISEMSPEGSVILRETFDNWTVDVASRFIAEAVASRMQ